jgi:hypothetical protein
MEDISDQKFDEFLSRVIPQLAEAGELEDPFEDAEPVPVPEHLKAKIMSKAVQLSGMVAAQEARAEGIEINGWEPSPGGDRAHSYMTRPELLEFLGLNK